MGAHGEEGAAGVRAEQVAVVNLFVRVSISFDAHIFFYLFFCFHVFITTALTLRPTTTMNNVERLYTTELEKAQ